MFSERLQNRHFISAQGRSAEPVENKFALHSKDSQKEDGKDEGEPFKGARTTPCAPPASLCCATPSSSDPRGVSDNAQTCPHREDLRGHTGSLRAKQPAPLASPGQEGAVPAAARPGGHGNPCARSRTAPGWSRLPLGLRRRGRRPEPFPPSPRAPLPRPHLAARRGAYRDASQSVIPVTGSGK